MRLPRAYEIDFTHEATRHLGALDARDRTTLLRAVRRRLEHEPDVETRNRKKLRPNPVAPWELRVGSLRVYFDVEDEPRRVVRVLAVGLKERNRVRIGGDEVELG
jgi:mRNA-degrading endonuclease RelE of RelBE toxin-antitoxin system